VDEYKELKETVRVFFDDYLNVREESDEGRMFNPIFISCCRALKIEPLNEVLEKMRKLSGAGYYKESK
jgi:3'-phosphoadenosine 5'-phosphosulfate sulfotransferase (PAPS reductase)/FAD synthetase